MRYQRKQRDGKEASTRSAKAAKGGGVESSMRNCERRHLQHKSLEKFDVLGRPPLVVLLRVLDRDHLHLAVLFVLRRHVSAERIVADARSGRSDLILLLSELLLREGCFLFHFFHDEHLVAALSVTHELHDASHNETNSRV